MKCKRAREFSKRIGDSASGATIEGVWAVRKDHGSRSRSRVQKRITATTFEELEEHTKTIIIFRTAEIGQ